MATHEPGRPQPASLRETARQRAMRIPLDYYKRLDGLEKWRLWLSALALVVVLGGWLAWGWARSDQVRGTYSPGRVAAVHASWDRDCATCHVEYVPISTRNRNPLTHLLAGPRPAGDVRCVGCHAGPPHHASQREDTTPGCADCHREHRGHDFSLVRLPDSDCTGCHASLSTNVRAGHDTRWSDTITGFATDHPEFRALRSADPGRLKFNHKRHLAPGQVAHPDQTNPWTLGKLRKAAPEAYERYRAAPWQVDRQDSAPVRLECASCHVRDAGDPGGLGDRAAAPRAAGAAMLPVSYEAHCKACHPLTFDPQVKGDTGRPLAVPHRLQPDEVRAFLWGAYGTHFLKTNPSLQQRLQALLKEGPRPTVPLPGKLGKEEEAARNQIGREAHEASLFLFKDHVRRGENYLFLGKTTCGECHTYEPEDGPPRTVVPPNVREVWFEHARFNHAAHRAVDCKSCHAGAEGSASAKDVLVPGIENCKQCHSPRRQTEHGPVGGVRHDCVECHSYHNGDRPLQGPGAAKRDPERKTDIPGFLRGLGD